MSELRISWRLPKLKRKREFRVSQTLLLKTLYIVGAIISIFSIYPVFSFSFSLLKSFKIVEFSGYILTPFLQSLIVFLPSAILLIFLTKPVLAEWKFLKSEGDEERRIRNEFLFLALYFESMLRSGKTFSQAIASFKSTVLKYSSNALSSLRNLAKQRELTGEDIIKLSSGIPDLLSDFLEGLAKAKDKLSYATRVADEQLERMKGRHSLYLKRFGYFLRCFEKITLYSLLIPLLLNDFFSFRRGER